MAIHWGKKLPDITAKSKVSSERERGRSRLHDEMCIRAEVWLKRMGCKFTFGDKFGFWTINGEKPDAIGFMNDVSILVEVKITRSDFLSDKNKSFRVDPEKGMGDWRFYMCPKGIIKEKDLPDGWGLIYCDGYHFESVFGLPSGNSSWVSSPFRGNKRAEMALMYSAVSRAKKLGLMDKIKSAYVDE